MNDLTAYGLSPRWTALFNEATSDAEAPVELARVIRQDRGFVVVTTDKGQRQVALRSRKTGPAVVGDWVAVDSEMVVTVLERQSLLTRRDAHSESEQPLVANVDLVLIVCGVDRGLNARRIERAVAQTWDAGSTPLVVMTKTDLVDDAAEMASELLQEMPTVEIVMLSSKTGSGIEDLKQAMTDRTCVAFGESGAGKSTLVNALIGRDVVETGEVRETDSKGRHTTTRRELYLLPFGGALIDTPGVRALGLWAEAESVDQTFPEIAELLGACRFNDCAHDTEPGCAITEAVSSGEVSPDRLQAWKTLTKEAEASELRKSEHEKRQYERKFGRAVDEALRLKGKRP